MKTIGLLGGTSWSSTIGYYKLINELVHKRLGGYHSAKILLKSVDYNNIMIDHKKDEQKLEDLLFEELLNFTSLNPDCLIICSNSLYKYYDIVKHHLYTDVPVLHAIELVAKHIKNHKKKNALLLAIESILEDGYFAKVLEEQGINVVIPNKLQRSEIQKIVSEEPAKGILISASRAYFAELIKQYQQCDVVIVGSIEYQLLVDSDNSVVPVVDSVFLQAACAVEFALHEG